MNRNQVKGRIRAAKGKGKEVVGKAVGNTRLESEGTVEKLTGKAEAAYGDLKRKIQKKSARTGRSRHSDDEAGS